MNTEIIYNETDTFTESFRERIEEQFSEQLKENGIENNFLPFNIVACHEGEKIGAVSGFRIYQEIYVDELIVFKEYRGRGIGRRLMELVEEKFREEDLDNINLVTNEFQAVGFYEKIGFHEEYVRVNRYDHRLNKHYMVKYLR
ncbi:MAG: GNAT family N-acetyltransferase [Clostridia bacterium]|jgi:ribosomal protein S18 acetylase RimI-like enzyme|nr:GNAT family N-acetyltransferase [Clostridia bacterium]MBR0438217.1 GNAT family N-acetyltransferase [Clostridia bacterium]MBR4623292.1 GNAT family N-acetyltransferase [Clostridia bacterium]